MDVRDLSVGPNGASDSMRRAGGRLFDCALSRAGAARVPRELFATALTSSRWPRNARQDYGLFERREAAQYFPEASTS